MPPGPGPPVRARLPCFRLGLGLLVAGLLVGALAPAAAAQDDATTPIVDVVEIDGVIDQTIADFVTGTIDKANREGAELVAIQLDTPGALGTATQQIVDAITASEVPVLSYVGPAGARAAGAGTFIASASHVLAMSPVAQMGVAVPVDLGGGDLDEAATSDAAAQLVALADLRGRSTRFAEAAVTDARVVAILAEGAGQGDIATDAVIAGGDVRALTPDQAVEEGIVDLVEPTLSAALDALSGTEVDVRLADGTAQTRSLALDAQNASVRFNNLGLAGQVLHTVANPTLAYLLLVAGALTMLFELFQPGFGVAGVAGLAMAGLGVYGLSVLPVNWLAFALVVLGLVLLAIDVAVAGLGALTASGALALAVGSSLLFRGPEVLGVSPWLVAAVTAFTVLFTVVIMTTVLRAQGNQALAGAETLVGQTAVVRSMLNPEGHVFVGGALWRARAPEDAGKVKTGRHVRVVGLGDQLTLDVELVETAGVGSRGASGGGTP